MKTNLILSFLAISLIAFSQKKPEWVNQAPISNTYYIGIAAVEKSDNPNYEEEAKKKALSQIASSIQVSIEHEATTNINETNKEFNQTYSSTTQLQTSAELEGFEYVDSWQNKDLFYAYYRLSKAKYRSLIEEKRKRVANEIEALIQRATDNTKAGRPSLAISNYIQGFITIKKNITKPLKINDNGQQVFAANLLKSNIEKTLASIDIIAKTPELNVKSSEIEKAQVLFILKSNATKKHISGIPVRFKQIDNESLNINSIDVSNNQGEVTCNIQGLKKQCKQADITATIDLEYFIKDEATLESLRPILQSIITQKAKTTVKVQAAMVYIEANEKHFGTPAQIPFYKAKLSRLFKENAFDITDKKAECDYIVKVTADSRKGTEVYSGMFSVFLNTSITIHRKKDDKMVYSNNYDGLKGIQLSYENASKKAYDNSLKTIKKDLIDNFLNKK